MSTGIKRVLLFNEPIKYHKIKIFSTADTNITDACQFAWSVDGVCWTNYTTHQKYNEICPNLGTDFYLRVLFVGELYHVLMDDIIVSCYYISLYNINPFTQNTCDSPNLFQPYSNLDCALQLQTQLADTIMCIFGFPCYYFKVKPDEESVDYTFKEYVLHSVESVKIIKLISQDGELPSSVAMMNKFDFDWNNDWEIECGKTDFARAFGDEAYPKQRDFIYIPMMKRMFQVNGAYDEKNEGLMYRPTTWKLQLVKYQDKDNINNGDFDGFIGGLVDNFYTDTFGDVELVEQERVSGTSQADPFQYNPSNITNIFLEDAVRKSVTDTEKGNVVTLQINHRNRIVARNAYQFTDNSSILVYQNFFCGTDGNILIILKTPVEPGKTGLKSIFTAGDIKLNYTPYGKLEFNKMESPVLNNNTIYLTILSWNRSNFAVEMVIYEHKLVDESTPAYIIRPDSYAFDFENPIFAETSAYNDIFLNKDKVQVMLSPAPLTVSNVKLYENYLGSEEAIEEALKYTTTHKACVINDLCRPMENPYGYPVR